MFWGKIDSARPWDGVLFGIDLWEIDATLLQPAH